ncbi:MAG: 3-deoxy-8-phosphooctulonate synthase [Pseudomonadota bacterium]
MIPEFAIGPTGIGGNNPPLLIAGPCVLESTESALHIAKTLKQIALQNGFSFVFKASYDKANRTSVQSYRGPGIAKGLEILARVRDEAEVSVLSDVHSVQEVGKAAKVLDVLQIPAFLCRQTDLLVAAAGTMKPLNIKKGQFLAPWDMKQVIDKVKSTGNRSIMITERGTSFGYNNLVVDMRSLVIMREFGLPVIFDGTHSVQLPGGQGSCSGGQREFVPHLCRAALAVGVEGIFLEVHADPDRALCDGPNSLPLGSMGELLSRLKKIYEATTSR